METSEHSVSLTLSPGTAKRLQATSGTETTSGEMMSVFRTVEKCAWVGKITSLLFSHVVSED